jgi:hypothetical protein
MDQQDKPERDLGQGELREVAGGGNDSATAATVGVIGAAGIGALGYTTYGVAKQMGNVASQLHDIRTNGVAPRQPAVSGGGDAARTFSQQMAQFRR